LKRIGNPGAVSKKGQMLRPWYVNVKSVGSMAVSESMRALDARAAILLFLKKNRYSGSSSNGKPLNRSV
jgi:hypothetical protein